LPHIKIYSKSIHCRGRKGLEAEDEADDEERQAVTARMHNQGRSFNTIYSEDVW